MKINNENLSSLIRDNFDRERYQGAGMWGSDSHKLEKEDLNDLSHFYNNSFHKGLLEWPAKTVSITPRHTKKFYLGWFMKEYLPSKIFAKKKESVFKKEFELFRETGLIFPKHNPTHSNFYYSFENKSFNQNIHKYSAHTSFIKNYTEHEKTKTVCEIGGGLRGFE